MIKNKERRSVIEGVAASVVPQFFVTKQRLKVWLGMGWDLIKIVDHATMPCLLETRELAPPSHFDILNTHDTNTVQRCIAEFASKYEGHIEPRQELLLSVAPKLEGDNAAIISRRDDFAPTSVMEEAGEYLSSTALVNHDDLVSICLDHRGTLDGWDPVTGKDAQEQWLPKRAVDEINRVGSSVFFALTNFFDSRARMYANTKGSAHPMYCKKSRGFMMHESYWDVNDKQLEDWATDLKADTGLDAIDMERLFHGKNPQKYLANGGSFPLLCEIKHFLEAKATGRTRAFGYIDAFASGITLKELSTGWPKAVQNADATRPGWKHPRVRYVQELWTDVSFKAAVRGTGNQTTTEYLDQLQRDMKQAITAASFSAGGKTMGMCTLGHPVDGEDPFTPDDVSLVLPESFNRWLPKDPDNWIDDFCNDFKRPMSKAYRSVFPADTRLNAHLQAYWKGHVGEDFCGIPPSWRMPDGFTHQPVNIRRNRDVHNGLHFHCPITDTRTTVQRKVLEPNKGRDLSPNVTHAMDALIMRICVLLMKQEGIPVIAIHDSVGVPIMFLRRANQLYVEATNWVISHNIWGQFGFKPFGEIPVLHPDCGLLGR